MSPSPLVPLSVLDLSPVSSGQQAGDALRNTIDLAVAADEYGYNRYWLAEHHLNPGVAGAAPHVLSGLILAATRTIRVGTAATIVGNYRPLQVAENVGTLSAVYPGRLDLGFGRSGPNKDNRPEVSPRCQTGVLPEGDGPGNKLVDGLVIPAPRPLLGDSLTERLRVQAELLGRRAGDSDRFENDVQDIVGFFTGDFRTSDGKEITVTPARGNAPEFWIHGSTAGPSARLAGKLGLPFGANYHVSPATVLESIAEYRTHFKPSELLSEPYVAVSADVLVAKEEAQAQSLAAGYASWVHSVRMSQGAILFPSPTEAALQPLGSVAADLIQDRLDTRFVGNPSQVTKGLRTLQQATGANELLITTIVHDYGERVRSYALLADAWNL